MLEAAPWAKDSPRAMLIVVEGCVGVGKSTVAKGLAAYRSSAALLEAFESNPFLRAFYEDPVGNALETEFAFLLLHFHQLKGQINAVGKSEVIADFHLGKDLLYAELNIADARTRRAFMDLYSLLLERVPKETLMVCLSATTDLLLERIRRRKRDFEIEIDGGYFAKINAKYEEFYTIYPGRKLRISMNDWDFIKNPGLFDKLSLLVDEELKK